MFQYRPTVTTLNGEQSSSFAHVDEERQPSGAVAVSIRALCRARTNHDGMIHPEKGVTVTLSSSEEIVAYMANYRHSEYWCKPAFGKDLSQIPDETQMLLCRLADGDYVVFVPVVNEQYKSVFFGTPEGEIAVRCFSRYDKLYTCRGLSFIYARGKHPHALVETCVRDALRLLNNGTKHRTERRYPEIMEYLGWCSWDSMQIRVNEDGIFEKCEEFKQKNIPVRWGILDDMWSEVRDFYGETYDDRAGMFSLMHRSSLWHYKEDPIRFPHGLAYTVQKMKEYGIRVGAWHPTTGYWRGIDPAGDAQRELKDYLIEAPGAILVPDWHVDKSYLYYKTIHDYYSACGVDFVKIDNQSMSRRFYSNLAPVGEVCRQFHDGMEASVGQHFDNAMINCMGMASEDIWTRRQSPISRCSDDFQPENRAWFQRHVMQCAYNSFFQGQLYWCDWDMWWTDDAQGPKNSLLRAISGGPIYVSDEIGRSCAELLRPLALSDGRILRPDRPATPTEDCLVEDATENGKALKIQNTVKDTYGLVVALNIDTAERAVTATLSASDVIGLPAGAYAVYEFFSGECRILAEGESFDTVLSSPDDYRLYIFSPIVDGFAVIGRTDKFISPATVASVHGEHICLLEDGPFAYVKDGVLVHVDKK